MKSSYADKQYIDSFYVGSTQYIIFLKKGTHTVRYYETEDNSAILVFTGNYSECVKYVKDLQDENTVANFF